MSGLAETWVESLRQAVIMRAGGTSEADVRHYLENVLRTVWPQSREEPWKYLCTNCDDSGLNIGECPGDATCGRAKRHGAHTFGTPCWCGLGKRFKVGERPTAEDASDRAAKIPKTFTRYGR